MPLKAQLARTRRRRPSKASRVTSKSPSRRKSFLTLGSLTATTGTSSSASPTARRMTLSSRTPWAGRSGSGARGACSHRPCRVGYWTATRASPTRLLGIPEASAGLMSPLFPLGARTTHSKSGPDSSFQLGSSITRPTTRAISSTEFARFTVRWPTLQLATVRPVTPLCLSVWRALASCDLLPIELWGLPLPNDR